MRQRSSTVTKDLIALFGVAAVAVVVAVYFDDPFENYERWTQVYEGWHLDEILVVAMVLTIVFGFYSWRRQRELEESEEHFRSLVQNAADVITTTSIPKMSSRCRGCFDAPNVRYVTARVGPAYEWDVRKIRTWEK